MRTWGKKRMKGSAHSCSKCEEFHVNIRKRGSALAPALVSPSLYPATPLPFVCFRLSLGILCILAMLCNASALRRQTSSSVFLLHCCTAGLPRVCVCAAGANMFLPARVCARVHISLAVCCCQGNGGHMAQAASRPSTARVVLQEASFSWKQSNARRHTHTHSHTHKAFLHVTQRWTDRATDRQTASHTGSVKCFLLTETILSCFPVLIPSTAKWLTLL